MTNVVATLVQLADSPELHPVALRHYEELRDRLDRNERGWVELESVFGDGRLLCRVQDIQHLFLASPGWVAAWSAWEAEARLTDSFDP